MNRRTRLIEESFDVTFDDFFVQKFLQNHVTTHIMDIDTPSLDKHVQQIT